MKKNLQYSMIIFLSGLVNTVAAQEKSDANTLFGNTGSISADNLGLFIAPSFGFTSMDRGTASLFNLRGGVIMQDKVSLGGFFSTSINEINPESETVGNVYMDYWSVGGFAEYALLSNTLLHVTFPVYFGYGEVQMDNDNGDAGLGEANFFQIEPSALLEINIHKYVRLNAGAGYRVVGEMNYRNFDHRDISGLTGYIGLKFGLFRQ